MHGSSRCLIVVAVYAVGKFRGGAEEERLGASELLSNFRELHSEGDLSDEEFRTIKTLLSGKLQRERLRNSGEKRVKRVAPVCGSKFDDFRAVEPGSARRLHV